MKGEDVSWRLPAGISHRPLPLQGPPDLQLRCEHCTWAVEIHKADDLDEARTFLFKRLLDHHAAAHPSL